MYVWNWCNCLQSCLTLWNNFVSLSNLILLSTWSCVIDKLWQYYPSHYNYNWFQRRLTHAFPSVLDCKNCGWRGCYPLQPSVIFELVLCCVTVFIWLCWCYLSNYQWRELLVRQSKYYGCGCRCQGQHSNLRSRIVPEKETGGDG